MITPATVKQLHPLPRKKDRRVLDHAIALLEARAEQGYAQYGASLDPDDPDRKYNVDAIQEQIDGLLYLVADLMGHARPATPLFRMTIPALPDTRLVTNARDGSLNRYERARLVREAWGMLHPLVYADLKSAGWDGATPLLTESVRLEWVLLVKGLKGPDDDGWIAALKPWRDELVAPHDLPHPEGRVRGLLPNDGPRYVRKTSVEIKVDPDHAPFTILRVYPHA